MRFRFRAHRRHARSYVDLQEPEGGPAQTGLWRHTGKEDEDVDKIEDPIYVLAGRDEGYVPFYDGYPAEVVDGNAPRTSDSWACVRSPR